MKTLVIGYGSIGARHARILGELGCDVSVVTSRSIPEVRAYRSVAEALSMETPSYIVVATETARHAGVLTELGRSAFRGTVLVEKPLFDRTQPLPENDFRSLWVGYNLRFHPILRRLRDEMRGRRLICVQAYVGQYLPNWRQNIDYRTCYSASKSAGGGVLRDLSHELDYILWICGDWKAAAAMGGRYSSLEISSDDAFGLLVETERAPVVSVQMNYLDRAGRREIIMITDDVTFRADLVAGTLQTDGAVETFDVPRDLTYRDQHRQAMIGSDNLCSVDEAMSVVRLIEAAESSAAGRKWVENQ